MPLQINGLGKFRLYSAPRRQALSDTRAKGSRRRPPHTKSRGGCHSCKESRVKCDEARPKCQRLLTRQKSCIYDRSGPVDLMQHGLLDCSISPIVSSSLVECGYGPDSYRTCKRMQDSSGITPGAHLTQNFVHCIDTSFASEAGRVIAKRFLLSGCVATLMLMHALLALSARSIQHHQPMDWSHEVAFRYHSQETSGLLNTAIQQGVDAHNIDLVYATCLVINIVNCVYVA